MIPDPARVLWWRRGGLVPGPDPESVPWAADSWLVTGGGVRALDRHRDRFAAACRDAGTPLPGPFWDAVTSALPRTGRWFPRVELGGDGLLLRIRPAPARGGALTVRPWSGPDPRRFPWRKGPDLAALAACRSEYRDGADDLLLLGPGGEALESTTSSLLWWEDGVLCRPPADAPVLPGVTAAVLEDVARASGVPVRRRAVTVPELAGRETWLVNALHGIRAVRAWAGGTDVPPPGTADRLASWRDALERHRAPLPAPGAASTAVARGPDANP